MCESIPLKWSLGVTDSFENAPNEWMPASVPGTIQQDISEYFRLEPLYVNDTVRFFDKYEDMYAIYRAKLPDGIKREHLVLEGKGIDYALQLKNEDVVEALGGLPPVKIHCSVLAEEAIKKAIGDYYTKKGIFKEEKHDCSCCSKEGNCNGDCTEH